MPNSYKKRFKLSAEMDQLKQEIHTLTLKNIPLVKRVHRESTLLFTISGSIANFFNLLTAILNANKNIPIVGFFLQMISMIPRSLSVITDPEKSLGDKIFSTVFLATIVALSIAAFIVGAKFAVIAGTIVAASIAVVEGVALIGKIIEKYQASRAYDNKYSFNELVRLRQVPADNKYDELFEIRAIELKNIVANDVLDEKEKENLSEELNFISEILKQKNIILGNNQRKAAFLLQELYKKREFLLAQLTRKMALIQLASAPTLLLHDIQLLQNEILLTNAKIDQITAPIEKLNIENMVAGEKLAIAFSTFTLASAGALLSIIGLMIAVSSIAMPPLILPVMIGLGIGLAAVSLGKFVIEKVADHQDARDKENKSAINKESILEEALFNYENQLQSSISPKNITSYSIYMKDLLIRDQSHKPQIQSEPLLTEPPVVIYENPVFKKPLTSAVELMSSQEKTTTDKVTPTS